MKGELMRYLYLFNLFYCPIKNNRRKIFFSKLHLNSWTVKGCGFTSYANLPTSVPHLMILAYYLSLIWLYRLLLHGPQFLHLAADLTIPICAAWSTTQFSILPSHLGDQHLLTRLRVNGRMFYTNLKQEILGKELQSGIQTEGFKAEKSTFV